MATDAQPMKLDNWFFAYKSGDAAPPERAANHLHGMIFGHPFFDAGSRMTTAEFTGFDGSVAHTKFGLCVELGDIHPAYEKQYPHAKEILRSFNKHPEIPKRQMEN